MIPGKPKGDVTLGAQAAVHKEGQILLVRTTYGKRGWQLPGGYVAQGECPTDTLRREFKEELAITANVGAFIGAYFRDQPALSRGREHSDCIRERDVVLLFEATLEDETIARFADGELDDARYFSPDDLPREMSPRTRRMVTDSFEGRRGGLSFFGSETDAGSRIDVADPLMLV